MPDPVALLLPGHPDRPLLWRRDGPVAATAVLAQAQALAARLPPAAHLLNLCCDRGHFLIGFCAALIAGRTTLLPPSRTPRVLAEIAEAWAPAATIDDALVEAAIAAAPATAADPMPVIEPERVVAIGFTSGSTGVPSANPKTWAALVGSCRHNHAAMAPFATRPQVLATVPSQHMYGMELAVLLPLQADAAVVCAQPLFPQDLAAALADLPGPRVLVTTPVHLRAFVESGLAFPPLALVVCATAPLAPALAVAAEQALSAPLLELFGSTETCVIAARRTALDADWTPYPEVRLQPDALGTVVHAPWLAAATRMHDHIDRFDDNRFRVRGRCQDMVEIAGKRASLGDITARLLAVPGVSDAAVLQCEQPGAAGIQRLVAFVVAPGIDDAGIRRALRDSVDPAFVPRRLCRLERLPRNDTGKLRRDDLLALL
jgi:acyl-coenzyme A synthetase/AMP-(fatty) acid ligase